MAQPNQPYDPHAAAHHQVYGNPAHQQPAYPPGSPEGAHLYGRAPVAPPAAAHQSGRKRGTSTAAKVLGGLVVGMLGLCVGGTILAFAVNGSGTTSSTAPAGTVAASAAPAAPAKTAAAKPRSAIDGEGTFLVGTEVKAGVYSTTVPGDSFVGCYWARLRTVDTSDIIDNNLVPAGAKVKLTIRSSDKALEIRGECGTWTKIG